MSFKKVWVRWLKWLEKRRKVGLENQRDIQGPQRKGGEKEKGKRRGEENGQKEEKPQEEKSTQEKEEKVKISLFQYF